MNIKLGSIITVLFVLLCGGCGTQKEPILHGFYQSEFIGQYIIQLSFDKNDQTFIEYINNVDVNKGTYEKLENNTYLLKGNEYDVTFTLDKSDSFEMIFSKLNDANPIKLKKIGSSPTIFGSESSDQTKNEMKNLLD